MLTQVNFTITNGGLGRTAPSQDGIAATYMLFDTLPAGFANAIELFSTDIKEVEGKGILPTGDYAPLHYQLSEFFRLGGTAIYVGVLPVGTSIADAINTLANFSQGNIRLYGYADTAALDVATVGAIQTAISGLWNQKKPAHFVYGADISAITLANLPDLRDLASESPWVSVVIGQEGAVGSYPETTTTHSVPNVGAVLGALSSTDVATNILYVAEFNYASGGKMENPAFRCKVGATEGVLSYASDAAITQSVLGQLSDKGYIFWRFMSNVAGAYLSNDHTCSAATSDFDSIHNTRTIGKSLRVVDTAMTPFVGSKLPVNADGTIRSATISSIKSSVAKELGNMVIAVELSDFKVVVDPTQKPLATKTLKLQVALLPIGSADYINIEIGFTAAL